MQNRVDSDGKPLECNVGECAKNVHAGGMCNAHYQADRAHGNPLYTLIKWCACPVDGCERQMLMSNQAGLCRVHYQFKWRYGLDTLGVINLFVGRRCENVACGSMENLHIDHDHACCDTLPACGKCVRGWLCAGCNKALGLLREDPDRMRGLVGYLERG